MILGVVWKKNSFAAESIKRPARDTKSFINVVNYMFRLNYIYEPGRLPPRRQMFYQLVDVQIQQIAEEGFLFVEVSRNGRNFLKTFKSDWKIENRVIIFARNKMVG